jgi:SAM-dependent methyltransferase
MPQQRGINRKALRKTARLFQYLYHLFLFKTGTHYQSILDHGFYENRSERDCDSRWQIIKNALIRYQPRNVMDIGCGEGYYAIRCAREMGTYSFGVEGDFARFCIANAQIESCLIRRCCIVFDEISTESLNKLPVFEAIIFLSVLHHMIYSYGLEYAKKFLIKLHSKISKVLIFEMGQSNEVAAKWANLLPDMGTNPHAWIEALLLSCGFKNVKKIGESRSFFGDRNRAIFLAEP